MAIKYKWLASQLENRIKQNRGLGMDRLPSEQELCKTYQVSRQTVRQALALLQERNLIIKKQGSGSYINFLSANASENGIALLLPESEDYIYPGLINELTKAIENKGFFVRLFRTGRRLDEERRILQELLQTPCRGLIAEATQSAGCNPNLELYEKLYQNSCNIVFLNNNYPSLSFFPSVKVNNQEGSRLLVRHLIRQGHSAIAGIFSGDDISGQERAMGYMQELLAQALPFCDEFISYYNGAVPDFTVQKLNETQLTQCSAFLCQNDRAAYALILHLRNCGYSLPEDYAIVSFDHSYLSQSRILPITSLAHKPHEMANRAVAALFDQIKGLPVSSQEVPWTLVEQFPSSI